MSKHLDSNVINSCLDREHKPINPHSQRLLTAEARSAAKVPKANPKKPARKTPEKIDKSPADEGGKGGGKRKKTDKEKEAESGVPRTQYSMAKMAFMAQEWFLVHQKLLLGLWRMCCFAARGH